MSTKHTPDGIADLAGQYLVYHQALEEARIRLKDIQQAIKNSSERMGYITNELLQTVQPQCGSAHLPSRRIFQRSGVSEVLIVEWDDRIHRAVISVTSIRGV